MILDQEWRESHVHLGDQALKVAQNAIIGNSDMVNEMIPEGAAIVATALAAIAQAHYAAANVRARPVAKAEPHYIGERLRDLLGRLERTSDVQESTHAVYSLAVLHAELIEDGIWTPLRVTAERRGVPREAIDRAIAVALDRLS